MANSTFLTTFAGHRDPKLLWPLAAVASVLAHGVALAMVHTLSIQTPTLPEGAVAPLPIQLVNLPADTSPVGAAPATVSAAPPAAAIPEAASSEAPPPEAAPPEAAPPEAAIPEAAIPEAAPPEAVPPEAVPPEALTPLRPDPMVTQPPVADLPLLPAPAPAPPRPPAPSSAPPDRPPSPDPLASAPPSESPPSLPVQPPAPPGVAPPAEAEAPGAGSPQGGQVVPVGIRLNPQGRDIPELAPQLLGSAAIELQPLASGCGLANLDALLAGMVATTVEMQVRVEPSGDISDARVLQSTGNSAVDDLVSCVVKRRLRLQPATSAGVPQLTDAFILEARLQF
ncbi:MAG TPA: energy transducer TonB [Nodosilinea sp.]|nr:energy transducer TonB [Nodosilinea sp.]